VVVNLQYAYLVLRENILYDQNETQEPLELWTSSDPRIHEDSSPIWGAGMPETSSIVSLID
jgi:hypothetical protein